jgi:hypothetical protein
MQIQELSKARLSRKEKPTQALLTQTTILYNRFVRSYRHRHAPMELFSLTKQNTSESLEIQRHSMHCASMTKENN